MGQRKRFSLPPPVVIRYDCCVEPRGITMLRILGSPKTLCDGLTRRDFLHVGGLGLLGLGLDVMFRLQEAQAGVRPAAGRFGQARACILLFPYGSPPQHETFDPKPEAPAEVRGE